MEISPFFKVKSTYGILINAITGIYLYNLIYMNYNIEFLVFILISERWKMLTNYENDNMT